MVPPWFLRVTHLSSCSEVMSRIESAINEISVGREQIQSSDRLILYLMVDPSRGWSLNADAKRVPIPNKLDRWANAKRSYQARTSA